MEFGLVGKPNVGKSTFFAAATLVDAEIASYPFTTIDANRGVTYVRSPCPHTELGKACAPRNARPCARSRVRGWTGQLLSRARRAPRVLVRSRSRTDSRRSRAQTAEAWARRRVSEAGECAGWNRAQTVGPARQNC